MFAVISECYALEWNSISKEGGVGLGGGGGGVVVVEKGCLLVVMRMPGHPRSNNWLKLVTCQL